jgi:hypothetical protein
MVSLELLKELTDERIRLAHLNGVIEGLRMYSWYKDGTQYVGTCGTTLKKAIEEVEKEYRDKSKNNIIK